MNYSRVRFTLDLHKNQAQVSIPVSIGDTAKIFYINFTDGGQPFFLSEGCLAKMSIKRPTGTSLEAFCTIENKSVVKYDFSENESTAIVSGVHDCDVVLYSPDGRQLGSPRFTMVVDERVINREDIDITDETYTIVDAMVKAEGNRQIAESARVEAEVARVEAESKREEDTQKAIEDIASMKESLEDMHYEVTSHTHDPEDLTKVVPLYKGGTGADTAEKALKMLGGQPKLVHAKGTFTSSYVAGKSEGDRYVTEKITASFVLDAKPVMIFFPCDGVAGVYVHGNSQVLNSHDILWGDQKNSNGHHEHTIVNLVEHTDGTYTVNLSVEFAHSLIQVHEHIYNQYYAICESSDELKDSEGGEGSEPETPPETPSGSITVTINGITYIIPKGATWGDLNNALATPYMEFEPNEGVIALMSDMGPVSHIETGNLVYVNDLLVDGESYTLNVDFIIVKPLTATFRLYAKTGFDEFYDKTYTVSLGTTWAEWCATTYIEELGNFEWLVNANGIVQNTVNGFTIEDSNGNYVKGTDVIKSGLYTDGVNTPYKVTFRIYAQGASGFYYDETFTTEKGKTWAEWVEDMFDENAPPNGNWTITAEGKVYYPFEAITLKDSNGNYVKGTDVIVEGTYGDMSDPDEPETPEGTDLVTFRIYVQIGLDSWFDKTDTVASGTTWAEWCAEQNVPAIDAGVGEVWLNSGGYVYNRIDTFYFADSNGNKVLWDSEIVGGEYGRAY